ncbi:MAG: type IV toxin-antitoxin system AbiEi family antitoxin domain-containing protein [Bradymonadaceae bacterium]
MSTVFDDLLEVAQDQMGYFSIDQLDVERQYIHNYVQAGRLEPIMRGIYRMAHFPPEEHEDLMVAYLWSEREGAATHETALSLYGLSDILPRKTHITVPRSWKKRRRNVPRRFELHYADLESSDLQWHGPIPVTTLERTFTDLVEEGFDPALFDQALQQAMDRGLVSADFPRTLLKLLTLRRRS